MNSIIRKRMGMGLLEDLNKIHDDYYASISREDFDRVVALDPTFDPNVPADSNKLGKFGKWLLTRFRKGQLDEVSATEVLHDFNERSKYLNNEQSKGPGKEANKGNDINAYKSVQEVRDALECIVLTSNQVGALARKQKHYADLDDEAVFVAENDQWEVWRPLTYAADATLGRGSTWCTASSSGDQRYGAAPGTGFFYQYTMGENNPNKAPSCFSRYHDDGRLYVFLKKGDPMVKYQARVGDESREVTDFRNIQDRPANFPEFVVNSGLLDALKGSELRDTFGIKDADRLARTLKSGTVCLRKIIDDYCLITDPEGGNRTVKVSYATLAAHADSLRRLSVDSGTPNVYAFMPLKKYSCLFQEVDLGAVQMSEVPLNMFADNSSVVKIILPDTVHVIRKGAFRGCSALRELNIPDQLDLIELGAFDGCDRGLRLTKKAGKRFRVAKKDAQFIRNRLETASDGPEAQDESLLSEKLSGSMPAWLKGSLQRKVGDSWTLSKVLSECLEVNLEAARFIDVRPTPSPRAASAKYVAPPYAGIFHLKGDSFRGDFDIIFVKDFQTARCWGGDITSPWSAHWTMLDDVAVSSLLTHTVDYCCVDLSEQSNLASGKRKERKDAKSGSVDRLAPEDAENKLRNSMNNNSYYGTPSVDKSGYLTDPHRLVVSLERLHMSKPAAALRGYYKRLKAAKKAIISEYSSIDIKDGRDDEYDVMNLFSQLHSVIYRYREAVKRTDAALKLRDAADRNAELESICSGPDSPFGELRSKLLRLEQMLREHELEMIEGLRGQFREWCGDELYERFEAIPHREFTSRDYIWWMENSVPRMLDEALSHPNK